MWGPSNKLLCSGALLGHFQLSLGTVFLSEPTLMLSDQGVMLHHKRDNSLSPAPQGCGERKLSIV